MIVNLRLSVEPKPGFSEPLAEEVGQVIRDLLTESWVSPGWTVTGINHIPSVPTIPPGSMPTLEDGTPG